MGKYLVLFQRKYRFTLIIMGRLLRKEEKVPIYREKQKNLVLNKKTNLLNDTYFNYKAKFN